MIFRENRYPTLWIFCFSTAVTLQIRSRSPKSKQFFVMSQLYIHKNLVGIQPLIQRYCADKKVSQNFQFFYCYDLEN